MKGAPQVDAEGNPLVNEGDAPRSEAARKRELKKVPNAYKPDDSESDEWMNLHSLSKGKGPATGTGSASSAAPDQWLEQQIQARHEIFIVSFWSLFRSGDSTESLHRASGPSLPSS